MLNVQTVVVGMVSTNCYIVSDPETLEAVIIDPGDRADRILHFVRKNNLTVRYIFLTHGHFDHVLALEDVRRETGAKAVVHEAEPADADVLARHGDTFPLGGYTFELLHTPGHTPGSGCYRVSNLLFTGDTLFEDDCGRCDLPGGNYEKMLESLRFLASLEGDYTVYPGHDVSTTLSRERTHNRNMLEALSKP
jgi:glyoxylase-like metal-dependent hydrolase (beta-lactamase superfamily II)